MTGTAASAPLGQGPTYGLVAELWDSGRLNVRWTTELPGITGPQVLDRIWPDLVAAGWQMRAYGYSSMDEAVCANVGRRLGRREINAETALAWLQGWVRQT